MSEQRIAYHATQPANVRPSNEPHYNAQTRRLVAEIERLRGTCEGVTILWSGAGFMVYPIHGPKVITER